MNSKIWSSIVLILFTISGYTQTWKSLPQQQEELGYVQWSRSYEAALNKAKKLDKPLFILFQEVPGCLTCRNYGNHLLTHPHIVEAIETYFVPLVIFNNKKGDDAIILQKFNEPSWNNPVVRIIDHSSEKDIVKRLNGRYDMASLVATINSGILADNKLIPDYLDLLQKEHSAEDLRETHLSMFCFWTGEKHIGKLDGVISTQAEFMNGAEVVKVKYDASETDEKTLFSHAAQQNCADGVFSNDQREISTAKKLGISTKNAGKFRADHQPKYYTFNSDLRYLPMTSLQALKVNTAISESRSPDHLLSPRQLELLKQIKANKQAYELVIDKDFTNAWNSVLQEK